MNMLACPQCGSEFFVSTRSGEPTVFQMNVAHQPVVVFPEKQPKDTVSLNPQMLYCGACTWKGKTDALVASHM